MKLDLCKKDIHCVIWVADGQDRHVYACAHCKKKLSTPWFSSADDDARAAFSARSHARYCRRTRPRTRESPADTAIRKHFGRRHA